MIRNSKLAQEALDENEIDNNVCNNIESGFGRVSTLDPKYLENVQSYDFFLIKVGLERS